MIIDSLGDPQAGSKPAPALRPVEAASIGSAPALMILCAVAGGIIATTAALRSKGELTPPALIVYGSIFGALGLFALVMRPALRDMFSDFSMRERGFFLMAHIIAGAAPVFLYFPWHPIDSLLWLLLSLNLALVERQQLVRVFSVQLVIMLVAMLASVHDDLWDAALAVGLLLVVAFGAHAMHLTSLLEGYEVSIAVSPRWLGRAVGPAVLIVSAVCGIAYWSSTPRPWSTAFNFDRLGAGGKTGQPTGAGGPGGDGVGHLIWQALLLAGATVILIWFIEKLRDQLRKRRGGPTEEAGFLMVEPVGEPDREMPRRRVRPRDARQVIVQSYLDLTTRMGRLIRRRGAAETAQEYRQVLEGTRLSAGTEADKLRALTDAFDRARYAADPVTAEDAEEFRQQAKGLGESMEARWSASPSPPNQE